MDGMFSVRSILALFLVLALAISTITAAPNRVLMRFGKRAAGGPGGPSGIRFYPEAAQYVEYLESFPSEDNN